VIDTFSDEEIAQLEDVSVRDGALMQLLFDVGRARARRGTYACKHVGEDVRILRGKGGKDRLVPKTALVSQRVNELAILDGRSPKITFATRAPAATRRSPARSRSVTAASTAGGGAASRLPASATATRTSPDTASRPAGYDAEGGSRPSRRRWGTRRRRPTTCAAISTRAT
jgi:hypothetical protein